MTLSVTSHKSDPMLQSLFPGQASQPLNQQFSSALLAMHDKEAEEVLSHMKNKDPRSQLDYLECEFNLSDMIAHFFASGYPGLFSRKNFLFMQLLASATFSCNHYTRRSGLASYQLVSTFYGQGKLLYKDQEYDLYPDDVFLINCMNPHIFSAASKEGWGYRFLHFSGEPMNAYAQLFDHANAVKFTFSGDSRFYELQKELFLTNAENTPKQELLTNRIITDMISELLLCLPDYQDRVIPEHIQKQCSYIQQHHREKLSLDQLSRQFQISKYHMSREFKKYTGQSIHQYLTDCRLTAARKLLRYSMLNINEIALLVGYDDHNSFYRAFEQAEEMSPSEYRISWRAM